MARTTLALILLLTACEATPSLVGVSGPDVADAPVDLLELPSADWVPHPPFGWGVFEYEFFPDSVETTFDSISTTHDTVTWRYRDYPRFTAYGDGWEVPVWTDGSPVYAIAPRIEYYMTKIGRLGAGILNQVPKHGIALLDGVPGYFSLCDPLGATVYDAEAEVIHPLVVILVYDRFEKESVLCGDARHESVAGVMLHEFGHVLADPVLKCTEKWRNAVNGDSDMFPSLYAEYLALGHDPRTGTEDEDDINYWDCAKYPPAGAAEGDTIPSGEDVAESFAMWWLTRCKNGDEPRMDQLVASWFPNRLTALDSALDRRMRPAADTSSVPTCQFPILAADKHLPDRGRNVVPDGIIVR